MEKKELYDVFLRGTPIAILEGISTPKISITKVARYANASYNYTGTIISILEMNGIVTVEFRTKRDKIVKLTSTGEELLNRLLAIKEVCQNVI